MKNYRCLVSIIVMICSLIIVQQTKCNGLNDITTFLKGFIKKPQDVGSLFPCSSFVGKEITKYITNSIQDNPTQPVHILEVGAGTGSLTQEVVKKIRSIDHLDIVEISAEFCTLLQEKFGKYPNVSIHCCSITDWQPHYHYDFIICTLPFVSLEKSLMYTALDHLISLTKPAGIFSYVSFVGAAKLKKPFLRGQAKKDHEEKMKRLKELRKKYQIDLTTILQNCPPIQVYHLQITS